MPALVVADGFDLLAGEIPVLDGDEPNEASAGDSKIFQTFTADSTSVASGVVRLEARAIGTLGFLAVTPAIAADPEMRTLRPQSTLLPNGWHVEYIGSVSGGMQGLRDNPLSRVDFYAAVDTDGGARVTDGTSALKYIGSVSGATAGAIDYDGSEKSAEAIVGRRSA